MPLAPRIAVPLPTEELARMRDTLSPDYGHELWQAEGSRVLVVRVPRDEPDIVNDLEGAVESLTPSDVEGTPHVVLLGHRRTHIVPSNPVRDLMAARVRFDRAQALAMRQALKPGQHRLWKAPEDPKRLLRLAIRLPCDSVAQITPEHVAAFTNDLGPLLGQQAYQGIGAVYLVANRDDVRIEAGLFLQDLGQRYAEEQERHALAAQLVQKEEAARRQQEEERERLLEGLGHGRRGASGTAARASPSRGAPADADAPALDPLSEDGLRARLERLAARPAVTARAPLRAPARGDWEADDALPAARRDPARPASVADLHAAVDALTAGPADGPRARVASRSGSPLSVPEPVAGAPPTAGMARADVGPAASAPAVPAVPAAPARERPGLAELEAHLAAQGYATLRDPGVHGVDLAAERATFPSRVVAFMPPRLDRAAADQALAAAKQIGADLAIVVCAEADVEARRRFIATRARWLPPADVPTLTL